MAIRRKEPDPLAILAARPDSAPPGWSYKLAPDRMGMDAGVVQESPDFDESAMAITFPFAASQGRDREGDFLEVSGIKTENHRRNPVSYLEHGKFFPLPIGITQSPEGEYCVWIDPDRGLATCKVYLAQNLLEAQQAFDLYRQRILRAGSIGYRTIRANRLPPDPEMGLKAGLHLIETELLECTLTGLPANGDAVRRALEMPAAGKPLAISLKSMLAPLAAPAPVWAHGWTPPAVGSKSAVGPAMSAIDQSTGGSFVVPPRRKIKRKKGATMPTTSKKKKAMDGTEPAERIPQGAQFLGDLHSVMKMLKSMKEEGLQVLDNERVKALVEELEPDWDEHIDKIAELFSDEYPDLEGLEVDEEGDEPNPAPPAPGEPEPEPEKRHKPTGKPITRKGKRTTAPGQKRMTKSEMETVKEAGDFLHEHSEHPHLTAMEKAACMYHAKALGELCYKGMDGSGIDEMSMTDEEKALLAKVIQQTQEQLTENKALIEKALGSR